MKYAVDIAFCGMIYLISFMKVGAVLFCLRNLKGCNVGITDGKDL
jgi:hypothetical protein